MLFLTAVASVLVVLVTSKSVTNGNAINLRSNPAYGYLTKVGVPLANRIREAEAKSAVGDVQNAVGPSAKIVEGRSANLGEFPYQAGIIADLTDRGQSACGGSLLNARRVLTAAHCWWDGEHQAWRFTVVLGSITLFTGGTRLQTTQVLTHSQWSIRGLINDIAMVYLPYPVQFSNIVQPIALPSGYELQESFVGQAVIASGFGNTRDDDFTPYKFLRHVDLKVIPNAQCNQVYGNILPSKICTLGFNYKNTCRGDSGGPLTLIRNNRRILIGLTSHGSESCETGHPTAYTRVSYFINWISQQL